MFTFWVLSAMVLTAVTLVVGIALLLDVRGEVPERRVEEHRICPAPIYDWRNDDW